MVLLGLIEGVFIQALGILRDTSFIWSPIFLGYVAWRMYMHYIRAKWITNLKWVYLEIKLPKQILKSPKAMEVIIGAMHQTSDGNPWEIYTKGKLRSWFSLELVSIEGNIRFIIRMEAKFKDLIEAQIYSQYPDVEVYEVEDYTKDMPYGRPGSDWAMWGLEFKLTKDDAYPIKTYVDYGMEDDPKEDLKVDPLTPIIEFLGSLGPGEQVWMQIPIIASRSRFPVPGKWFEMQDWKKQGAKLVEKLMKRDAGATDIAKAWVSTQLSPGERKVVEAVERSLSKYGFDAGYRAIYFGRGDKFRGSNIGRLLSSAKQYGSENLNGFRPAHTTSLDEPWRDFRGIRLRRWKWLLFDSYCRRAYFYPPYIRHQFILNTEELATIYHFPGAVAITPTFKRIESRKAEPPANLPTAS